MAYAKQVSGGSCVGMPTHRHMSTSSSGAPTRSSWLEESDELPSGDALAAEITRFLREREADGTSHAPSRGGPGSARLRSASSGRLAVFGGSTHRRERAVASAGAVACGLRRRLGGRRCRGGPCASGAAAGDLRAVSFGAGRLSASAFAISAIVPSSSRAWSSARVRPRRVAVGRGEERRADRQAASRAATWTRRFDVLLVPVARASSRPRRAAASPRGTPSRRGGPAPCASRGRAATSSARGSDPARPALPSPIARSRMRTPAARSFSHGGACVTSVTRSSKSARSTGVATPIHRARWCRRRLSGFCAARAWARNCRALSFVSRAFRELLTESTRWSKRISHPAIVAQKRCSSSSGTGVDALPLALDHVKPHQDVGGHKNGNGSRSSFRRARRCWRRRGGRSDARAFAVELEVQAQRMQ